LHAPGSAQSPRRIAGADLAAPDQQADIVPPGPGDREEGIGDVEQLLEVAIPRGKLEVRVEHDHAVAHMVEGDAQLLLGRVSSPSRRAFSIAMTAWSAKVRINAI
jgi:hypothetical protein